MPDAELSFGSRFLDGLVMNEDETVKYRLSAYGEEDYYSKSIQWTLRLNRLPDTKAYVIRDIVGFLQSVRKETSYQIGKGYFEPLSFLQFDESSQDLIRFLWRLSSGGQGRGYSDGIFANQGRHLMLPSVFFEEGLHYLEALHDFQVEINNAVFRQLSFEDLSDESQLYHFEVLVHRHYLELVVAEKPVLSLFQMAYLFYGGVFYRLTMKQQRLAQALLGLPIGSDLKKHLQFSLSEQAKLAASLLDFKTLGEVKAPKAFEIRDFDCLFELDLLDDRRVGLHMTFDYGHVSVSSREELNQLPFTSHFKKEEKIIRALRDEGFSVGFDGEKVINSASDWYQFFSQTLPRLSRLGRVSVSEALDAQRILEQPTLTIDRQGGLLDVSFDLRGLDQEDVDAAMTALLDNQAYFVGKSGRLVIFDEETKKISTVLQDLRYKRFGQGHVTVNQLASYQLLDQFSQQDRISFSDAFYQLANDLRDPSRFEPKAVSVNATLRDYQTYGVKWLTMLHHYGFGGILADDMGLGKTLQTIAFLSGQLEDDQKVLILAPSSLIYNWKDEFTKFAPQLEVAVAYGNKPVRDEIIARRAQVTIASYAAFRQDVEQYSQLKYDYLILDEAQVIKNSQTKIAQSLRQFDVDHCFALSGTPIENRLLEIWSIFQIILPGLLPSKKAFLKLSAKEVARYITPFVLRRRKEDVLPELPDLVESVYANELTDDQKAIYLAQLQQMQEDFRGVSDEQLNRRKMEILSGITRLRQICDTPSLFMDYRGDSGKLESLRQLLLQIKETNRRALIFSQFKGMLTYAEEALAELGLSSYKLTGSTPAKERQEMTQAFNKGAKDVFLISLKAGGVGLNLTGADTVILIDLWWNPAVEMQAISRAHRLGQKSTVEVFRLITKGTIEEKILDLQDSKRQLVTTVLEGADSQTALSVDDLKAILGI